MAQLKALCSAEQARTVARFVSGGEGRADADRILGVLPGKVFPLANIRRHDRIDNWDLVDRAAPHVVGRYLMDRPRDVLYKLARSRNPWERRTAVVSTYSFIRAGDVKNTFRIAEILVSDEHALVQKATGSWLREAGKRDESALLRFLQKHAARMPRTTLRYATEKLGADLRARFTTMKRPGARPI